MKPDDDQAERWAIRLDAGPLQAHEEAELNRWLGEDEQRQGALLRAEATLLYLDRGRALSGVDKEVERRISSWRNRRRALLAAGVVGGLGALGLGRTALLLGRQKQIDTEIGEIRRVPLSDGSLASLNTASRVDVQMQPDRRLVKIKYGEAWFQVAHDQSRPFDVEAGEIRVRAVGTAFSVRLRDDGADVLVTEGVVETWRAGDDQRRNRIAAGSRCFVAASAPPSAIVHASDQIERELAWRSGQIALDGESVNYAVEELNRYNRRKLIVEDPALGREPLVGYFRTNDPESFGRAVAGMLGARVVTDGETIRLARRQT